MHRALQRLAIAAIALSVALASVGCGAVAEPGAETFYTQHAGEATRASSAVVAVAAHVAALPPTPTRASLEALALDAHAARRPLLAAADWPVSEDGEEEGVSQAELEVNEGAGALLKAMAALRKYAVTGSHPELALYRYEIKGGRERWDQGLVELWHVLRRAHPPRI